jgi:hypothetical protein
MVWPYLRVPLGCDAVGQVDETIFSVGEVRVVSRLNRYIFEIVSDMKMAVFWVFAPCSQVEIYRRFRGAYYLHNQVGFYETTRRSIPEESPLHTRRRENLKSRRCLPGASGVKGQVQFVSAYLIVTGPE